MTTEKLSKRRSGAHPELKAWGRDFRRNGQLYILALPALAYFIIFCYIPLYGAQIAFKEFIPSRGIAGSAWVGLEQFERFFNSYQFQTLFTNTLILSFENLIFRFPFPILLALFLNQLNSQRLKRVVQTVTYAPYFISTAAMCGMIIIMLSPSGGILYRLLTVLAGGKDIGVPMGNAAWFRRIYVISGIWQMTGWEAIIYIAALTSVSPDLYEAADIDGANKWQKIWFIDLPALIPTAITVLILNVGRVMSLGFEKVYLLQNSMNLSTSEIISTYVYKIGIMGGEYSYSSAIGLFNSVINLILVVGVNFVSKKLSDTSLW